MLVYPLFIGTWELILIILIFVLIFGGKKIPELMKGLGKGVKSFKDGMNDVSLDDDENKSDVKRAPAADDLKDAEKQR